MISRDFLLLLALGIALHGYALLLMLPLMLLGAPEWLQVLAVIVGLYAVPLLEARWERARSRRRACREGRR